jgi:polyhydroxybutyrate depolymerase
MSRAALLALVSVAACATGVADEAAEPPGVAAPGAGGASSASGVGSSASSASSAATASSSGGATSVAASGGMAATSSSAAGAVPGACAPGEKTGPASGATGEKTPGGLDYDVRLPPGYDPTAAHPLLVVYSPAGVKTPSQTEAFTGLTGPATARSYLVGYANHAPPNDSAAIVQGSLVIDGIAARWCIDAKRVFLTGHSDGGGIAVLVAINNLGNPRAAAIAPSASGAKASWLAKVSCPNPVAVMVIHSSVDTLFPPPDYGPGHAGWWASCGGCGASAPGASGCLDYASCAAGADVRFCQTTDKHSQWPALNEAMLDFFDAHALP